MTALCRQAASVAAAIHRSTQSWGSEYIPIRVGFLLVCTVYPGIRLVFVWNYIYALVPSFLRVLVLARRTVTYNRSCMHLQVYCKSIQRDLIHMVVSCDPLEAPARAAARRPRRLSGNEASPAELLLELAGPHRQCSRGATRTWSLCRRIMLRASQARPLRVWRTH